MNFLPKASGTRPRVACEIMAQAVVAARSNAADAPLAAVARVALADGAVVPGLKPSNIVDRVAVVAAIRRVLDELGEKTQGRGSVSLVIPDSAVRVLLLDFESLPGKLAEALPLVRFRLKKLLPFEADDAMVTFQTMSTSKNLVRVLAVAIPRDVLSEYETVVREAGFEPGAVLPSTLASLAAVESEEATLLVNANPLGVTTAIVRAGILMLHRSVDLQEHTAFTATPVATEPITLAMPFVDLTLPLVDVEATAGEWAAQEALPEHGRNPYADLVESEAAVQDFDAMTGLPEPNLYTSAANGLSSPNDLQPVPLAAEIAQAVSVAAAYFEDTLAIAPTEVLSAGPLSADKLGRILIEQGIAEADGVRVRELVSTEALLAEATISAAPQQWLSGVLGALRG
jgi:type IV pilus assembly protein PilM